MLFFNFLIGIVAATTTPTETAATTTPTETTTTTIVTADDSVGPPRHFGGFSERKRNRKDGYRGSSRKRNNYGGSISVDYVGFNDKSKHDGYGGYGYGEYDLTCSGQACYPPNSTAFIGNNLEGACVCGPSALGKHKINPIRGYERYAAKQADFDWTAGLCLKSYTGYWCDNPDFFKSTKPDNCSLASSGSIEVGANQSVSYQLSGVFRARKTGEYYFRTTSNDASAIVLGHSSIVENLLIHNENECDSGALYLKKGFYDISVYYGNVGTVIPGYTFADDGFCSASSNYLFRGINSLPLCFEKCDLIPDSVFGSVDNCGAVAYYNENCYVYQYSGTPITGNGNPPFKCYARGQGGDPGGSLKLEWKGPIQTEWTEELSQEFKPSPSCESSQCADAGKYGEY